MRHETLVGELHVGSGSFLRRARHAQGASAQYDDHVRQSASLVHETPVVGEVGDVVAVGIGAEPSAFASGSFVGPRGSVALHAATRTARAANPRTRGRRRKFCGAEGDRTPDLIHAMDALSQ